MWDDLISLKGKFVLQSSRARVSMPIERKFHAIKYFWSSEYFISISLYSSFALLF